MRSIKAFEKSNHIEDWNELMKLFMIRRTRSFIKKFFAKLDHEKNLHYLEFPDGRRSYFPNRMPHAIKFKTAKDDQYSRLYSEDMLAFMEELQLPRYGLNKFINEAKITEVPRLEKQVIDNLSRAGQRMMGFCKSTFFKRIDSSGFAFLLTVYRHILRNCIFLYAIENKLPLPIGDENVLPDDYSDDADVNSVLLTSETEGDIPVDATLKVPTDLTVYMEKAKEYYDIIFSKNNVSWLPSEYFKRTLKQQLKNDCDILVKMIQLCGEWKQETDEKLNELQKLIEGQHHKDKVIVFTQYSDTARYVYTQLKKRGIMALDMATGNSDNITAIVEKFSPVSNNVKDPPPVAQQTRILIATDVLSEGQNLQDAHVIVNFDLPWAIIRLIQRAGRVDRIGQSSDRIYCYSFFPADGVESIIKLRERLNNRINENANIVGSDEIFFEGNEQNLRDMFNERSGVLDDNDDSEVDLSSQAYQIWKSATEADPDLENTIPKLQNLIYSTKKTDDPLNNGVITYARNESDFDILTWLDANREFITQSPKKILDALRCNADEPAIPRMEQHHELVEKTVELIKTQGASELGGILGKPSSTRYRILTLLEKYHEDHPVTLIFSEEDRNQLKRVIDDIYSHPLQEAAKNTLGGMLRRSDRSYSDDIVDVVCEMHRSGSLCIIKEETNEHKRNTIICSMGIKYTENIENNHE